MTDAREIAKGSDRWKKAAEDILDRVSIRHDDLPEETLLLSKIRSLSLAICAHPDQRTSIAEEIATMLLSLINARSKNFSKEK